MSVLARAAGSSALAGLVAALALTGRVLELDEAASDRTRAIILIAFAGAFLAMLPLATIRYWLAARWPGWLVLVLGTLLMAGLFAIAMAGSFAIQNRLIEGHIEEDLITGFRLRSLMWSHIGAVGLFTPTGRTYLLPWPLPLVALAAGLILARTPRLSTERRP
jgi:hypothetical protein